MTAYCQISVQVDGLAQVGVCVIENDVSRVGVFRLGLLPIAFVIRIAASKIVVVLGSVLLRSL